MDYSDDEVVERCEQQIEKFRSISVWHFMETILKIPYNKMLVRRIRARILENNRYIEDVEVDAKGFNRIRFNPHYNSLEEQIRTLTAANLKFQNEYLPIARKEASRGNFRFWINALILIVATVIGTGVGTYIGYKLAEEESKNSHNTLGNG